MLITEQKLPKQLVKGIGDPPEARQEPEGEMASVSINTYDLPIRASLYPEIQGEKLDDGMYYNLLTIIFVGIGFKYFNLRFNFFNLIYRYGSQGSH